MADEKRDVPADQPQQEKPKKGGSKKLLIIIAGAALVLCAGGFFAYTMLFAGKGETGGAESHEKKNEEKSVLFAIDPFVLNLAEQGRFLKVSMQFEFSDASYEALVADKVPQLRDAIITLVSSKSVESVESPDGKFQLKDELLLRANQAIGKEVFKNLYFTEFVMQ